MDVGFDFSFSFPNLISLVFVNYLSTGIGDTKKKANLVTQNASQGFRGQKGNDDEQNISKIGISNGNGLPFSDEMYDHLKFVIGKLSARMRTPRPMSVGEFQTFEDSVHAIINDAINTGTRAQPIAEIDGH